MGTGTPAARAKNVRAAMLDPACPRVGLGPLIGGSSWW